MKKEVDGDNLIKVASMMKLEDFLIDIDIPEEDNPSSLLNEYIQETQMTVSQIARKAGIDENYCGKILNGKRVNPSRDYLILIGIALNLDIEKVNLVLRKYKQRELMPNESKRDAIIFHGIVNKKDKKEINFDLDSEDEDTFK